HSGLFEYIAEVNYDLIFSNSAMHWILPPEKAYAKLFQLLKHGGRIAVHQGGYRNYNGLWHCAMSVIEGLGLERNFSNWSYPAWYPTSKEMEKVLSGIGFVDINIESVESDGSEYPRLIENFARAGLLPFLKQIPDTSKTIFRREFLAHAKAYPPDLYTHRLYVSGLKP
ncbi:MAG: hypothetical protein J7L96_08390, partial [Bacteroidales bacterium]|nr:hypothetical protein [Bacteroidales bacterium]